MTLTRRDLTRLLASGAAGAVLPGAARAAGPVRGGTLNWVFFPEPQAIIAINTSSGTGQTIGTKINEGLLSYAYDLSPRPQLATEWSISPDGLRYRFALRRGVTWHDGAPFTADDVAFSVWRLREAHPRGRITFANVTEVLTPDPHTAEIVLSRPAPFLITALAGAESPIVPRHVYESLRPADSAPASRTFGTGPFVLKEWVPGSHLLFERNPHYWDEGKPYLDRIVMRIITDPAARAAAFEAGEVDLGLNPVPLADLARLKALPKLVVDTTTYAYSGPQTQLFFNLDTPLLQDLRVRQAVAHAIDLKALLAAVYFGYGTVSPTPVSVVHPKFHDATLGPVPFDPRRAEALLDEAGQRRGAGGVRFPLRLTVNPFLEGRYGDFVRQSLSRIGIAVDFQRYDLATYLTRVYQDRAFDLTIESLSNTFDPTLGVQRAYWSKNFKRGLPFSNAAHYADPEADRLLEEAAVERDEDKRRALFVAFQRRIRADLPSVDLIAPSGVIVAHRKVKDYAPGAEGLTGTFADLYIDPSEA
ncbi:ABC transporter substrate-binding protein [Methylobacterium sp. JK268]